MNSTIIHGEYKYSWYHIARLMGNSIEYHLERIYLVYVQYIPEQPLHYSRAL